MTLPRLWLWFEDHGWSLALAVASIAVLVGVALLVVGRTR